MDKILVQKIGYPSKSSKKWVAQCPCCQFFSTARTRQDAYEDMAGHIGNEHPEYSSQSTNKNDTLQSKSRGIKQKARHIIPTHPHTEQGQYKTERSKGNG